MSQLITTIRRRGKRKHDNVKDTTHLESHHPIWKRRWSLDVKSSDYNISNKKTIMQAIVWIVLQIRNTIIAGWYNLTLLVLTKDFENVKSSIYSIQDDCNRKKYETDTKLYYCPRIVPTSRFYSSPYSLFFQSLFNRLDLHLSFIFPLKKKCV